MTATAYKPGLFGRELHLGDCLEIMPSIPTGSVDMVMADLPYGTTQNKWDSVLPLDRLWAEYWRVLKPNGVAVFTAAQPFTSALVMSSVGGFRHDWSWNKTAATGHLNAKRQPMRNHEDVLVFGNGKLTYNPQGLERFEKITRRGSNGTNFGKGGTENFQEFTSYPRTRIEFSNDGKLHPTQKPVALMEYLIRTYTNSGETVLDNVMGSGTTGVACRNTGRNFVGIEKDEGYFEIAKRRIETAQP